MAALHLLQLLFGVHPNLMTDYYFFLNLIVMQLTGSFYCNLYTTKTHGTIPKINATTTGLMNIIFVCSLFILIKMFVFLFLFLFVLQYIQLNVI